MDTTPANTTPAETASASAPLMGIAPAEAASVSRPPVGTAPTNPAPIDTTSTSTPHVDTEPANTPQEETATASAAPADTAPAASTSGNDRRARDALFRSHARALLCGDAAEADRLRRLIRPEHLLAHQTFTLALFATCVGDHFGDVLDWARLDVLTDRLRRTVPGLSPLKTEALVRACYDEPHLLMEVPQSEQPAIVWAVCRHLAVPIPPGGHATATAATAVPPGLDDLLDRADTTGRDLAHDMFIAAQRYAWHA